jgi:hypothetical protein
VNTVGCFVLRLLAEVSRLLIESGICTNEFLFLLLAAVLILAKKADIAKYVDYDSIINQYAAATAKKKTII